MFESMTPLPGDPGVVTAEAQKMVQAADRMREAAAALRRIADSTRYRSDAVDALTANTAELETVMVKSEIRYRDSGNALRDYGSQLANAQAQAKSAIASLGGTDVGAARRHHAALKLELVNPLLDPGERHDLERKRDHARIEKEEQEKRAAQAWALYNDARRDADEAAKAATSRIHDAEKASQLNDTFGDHFKAFKDVYLSEILKAVVTVVGEVQKILGVVSIVLAFVPGLQVLAAALKVLSVALTVVTLAALAIQLLVGDVTIGAFLTASLLTLASLVKLRGAQKKAALEGKPKPFEGEGLSTSSKSLWNDLRDSHPAYGKGTMGLIDKGIDETVDLYGSEDLKALYEFADDPSGYVVEQGSEAVGAFADQMVQPGDLWTTDSAASHDVSSVGADFSGADVSSIVGQAFAGDEAGQAPRPLVAHTSGGGGGGGW